MPPNNTVTLLFGIMYFRSIKLAKRNAYSTSANIRLPLVFKRILFLSAPNHFTKERVCYQIFLVFSMLVVSIVFLIEAYMMGINSPLQEIMGDIKMAVSVIYVTAMFLISSRLSRR